MKLTKLLSTTVAAAAIAAISMPALAAEATVRELKVTASTTDAQDLNALKYYPELTGDLNAAIYDRVTFDDDPKGFDVNVSIQKIALDGDTALPDNHEFNEIEGVVTFSSPETNEPLVSYPVKVVAATGDAHVPAGYVKIAPSDDDFYNAMVIGFAEAVAQKMPEMIRDAGSR